MAQAIAIRINTFRVDNIIIDEFGEHIGLGGVALYSALSRFANRSTGECWPSIKTLAAKFRCATNTIRKHLRKLEKVGLITVEERFSEVGDHTSNKFTLHDPTNKEARLLRMLKQAMRSGAIYEGPPPQTDQSLKGGTANFEVKQGSLKQNLTSAPTEKQKSCGHATHLHPEPGIVVCGDCFLLITLDTEGGEARDGHGEGVVLVAGD